MTIRIMLPICYPKVLDNNKSKKEQKGREILFPPFLLKQPVEIKLIFIMMLCFTSCSFKNNNNIQRNTEKTDHCSFEPNITKTEIKIPFDFTYTYDEVENFYGWDKYIYFLNIAENTVYIYDSENDSLFRKLKPDIPVSSIYMYDSSNVFMLNEMSVTHCNWNLDNRKTYPINHDSITEYSIGKFSDFFPLSYDPKKDELYLQRSHWVFSYKQEVSMSYSVESVLHLKTGIVDSLPICYPNIYGQYDFGYMNNISRCLNDSINVYSFETDPDLYLYNRYTKEISVKGGKSEHQKKSIVGYNYKDNSIDEMDYFYMMIELASYPVIQYDPYRELYYRIFQEEQPLYGIDGKLNSTLKKKTWLQIYNTNFCLLQEYLLPIHNYYRLIVLKKGLAISRMTTKNPLYDKKNMEFDLYMLFDNDSLQ